MTGNASRSPLYLSGLAYQITITDTAIKIGCEKHSINDWDNFNKEQIAGMDGKAALRFWDGNKSPIMALALAHQETIIK